MDGYTEKVESIQIMLTDFVQNRVVDTKKLCVLDELMDASKTDQFKILNTSRLSLEEQRCLFGAVRNIYTTTKAMKAKLVTASERHENPRIADLCLEITQSVSNLTPYVDAYIIEGRMYDTKTINEFSRLLYKKAKYLGFSEDIAAQFREIKITPEEVKDFVKKLNENIELETHIDEEMGSMDESGH